MRFSAQLTYFHGNALIVIFFAIIYAVSFLIQNFRECNFLKRMKKTVILFIAVVSMSLTGLMTVSAQYGAAAVKANQRYTPAQMLTYAIEDEYLAKARYLADIEKFGNQRLFLRAAQAEKRHIALLTPIMAKLNVQIPEDRSAQFVVVPSTLTAAVKVGIDGEKNNMRMYDIFLKQQLPEDVKSVFLLLRNASQRHLIAFERNLARLDGIPSVRQRV
jgi:hypothetical protein